MNGERYPGESLPFEPSMRHADGRLIAIIKCTTHSCMYWQNEAKMLNLFNAHATSGAPVDGVDPGPPMRTAEQRVIPSRESNAGTSQKPFKGAEAVSQ